MRTQKTLAAPATHGTKTITALPDTQRTGAAAFAAAPSNQPWAPKNNRASAAAPGGLVKQLQGALPLIT